MLYPYCIGAYSIVSIFPASYYGFCFVLSNAVTDIMLVTFSIDIILFQVKVGLVPTTSIANAVINKRNCKNLH